MDRPLVNKCIETTNWDALREYASARNNGIKCKVHPKITNGVNHLVCLLEFENNARWVARIQMRESTLRLATRRQNEVNVMKILRERTKVPVPQVFGYEIDSNNPTGVAFVLMEFFPGNSAMDASGGYEVHRGILPLQHRGSFLDALAPVQAQMTSLRLPKIGTIIRNSDGSYDVRPLPYVGGPFETATAFFEAWGAHAKYQNSKAEIKDILKYGPVYDGIEDDINASIEAFPLKVRALANRLSANDSGPFPVVHQELGNDNIIVDSDYKIIGVVDWESASTVPWELVGFPLYLEAVPPPMDEPREYDEEVEESLRSESRMQKEYIARVASYEAAEGLDDKLSTTLNDQNIQNLAAAIHLWEVGKLGFYDKVLKPFEAKDGECAAVEGNNS